MTLDQVLPHVSSLTPTEKLRLIQQVASELICRDPKAALQPNESYPIWSPYGADQAAAMMMKALDAEKSRNVSR